MFAYITDILEQDRIFTEAYFSKLLTKLHKKNVENDLLRKRPLHKLFTLLSYIPKAQRTFEG